MHFGIVLQNLYLNICKSVQEMTDHVILLMAIKSNSYIMYLSDFPDMYTQARGPSGLRAWVHISGKSRGHVIQLICTMPMQAKSLQVLACGRLITQTNPRPTTEFII